MNSSTSRLSAVEVLSSTRVAEVAPSTGYDSRLACAQDLDSDELEAFVVSHKDALCDALAAAGRPCHEG